MDKEQDPRIDGGISRRETALIIFLGVLSAILRGVAFFRYRFDSDESQHLHVTWGWTAGLVQYRDIFDNHVPLFHMVTAPILRLAGEREDILFYMRVPMLVCFAVVMVGTYILARRLYSTRVAAWSVVLLSLIPTFFLKSLEYRTDNLWNAFWWLAIVVLTGGVLSAPRIFIAAFLLGCALATSLKTMLLIIALAAAGAMTLAAFSRRHSAAQVARRVLVGLAGVSIVPALVGAFFYMRGAWPQLVYCAFTFNGLLVKMQRPEAVWLPKVAFVAGMIIAIRVSWRYRPTEGTYVKQWRYFFATFVAFYLVTLYGFWLIISPRDYVAVLPILTIFGVAAIDRLSRARLLIYVTAAALFVIGIAKYTGWFANGTEEWTTMMHQALRLTRPGEPLMDRKGETIYRPRPFYYPFEFITRNLMHRGLIADTIPEDVIRTRCYAAQADGEFFPPRGRAFLNANFLDVGRLRAAGMRIRAGAPFVIAIPGEYLIIGTRGEVAGTLDGTPYRGARFLASGPHSFVPSESGHIAVLWAPAYERGFSPFHLSQQARR